MKRFFIFIFTIFSFLAFPVSSYAAASLSLSPQSGTFNRGCSVALKVELDTGGYQTDGTDAVLMYDPTRVTPASITDGTIYPDYPGSFIDTQARKINISGLASVTQPFNGTGTLATVNFTVPQNAPAGLTQITFDFDPNDKSKTTDSNIVERGTVADVLNAVTNGSYTIGTGTCIGGQGQQSATPSATPRGAPGGSALPGSSLLPEAGLSGPTIILAAAGMILVILGILGLALL